MPPTRSTSVLPDDAIELLRDKKSDMMPTPAHDLLLVADGNGDGRSAASPFRAWRYVVALGLAVVISNLAAPVFAQEKEASEGRARGGKVEWARLKYDGVNWARQMEGDAAQLNLSAMIEFPFISTGDLTPLGEVERRNLAEYLRRGGFVFVDACRNKETNADTDSILKAQLTVLGKEFPDLRAEIIPPTHELFSIYFKTQQTPPNGPEKGPEPAPLRAIFVGDRMVAIIGLNGFRRPAKAVKNPEEMSDDMRLLANIYVYAATR